MCCGIFISTARSVQVKEGVEVKRIIADRLVQLRGDDPREKVAEALQISVSALQMYENGQRVPRDDIKLRIAAYYNKSVQEIFFDQLTHETCSSITRSVKEVG